MSPNKTFFWSEIWCVYFNIYWVQILLIEFWYVHNRKQVICSYLTRCRNFFFSNFEKFTLSDKKICEKKFFNWKSFFGGGFIRGGINLKLLFKTLLKLICLIRDTAYRIWPNFRRNFKFFKVWEAVSWIKQISFKSFLNKYFRSIPSLNNNQISKIFNTGIFFNKFFLWKSMFFSKKISKKNLNFYNQTLSVLFPNVLC